MFFLRLQKVLMHMLISAPLTAWGKPSAQLQSSLSMQPSPLWHSALWTLASLAFSDSICSTQGELWALLGFPLLKSSLETLKAVSWGNYRAHLIYFLSLRDHCSSFSDIQCLKCHRFIYFLCFVVVSGGMGNLDSVALFWPKAKAVKY